MLYPVSLFEPMEKSTTGLSRPDLYVHDAYSIWSNTIYLLLVGWSIIIFVYWIGKQVIQVYQSRAVTYAQLEENDDPLLVNQATQTTPSIWANPILIRVI